MGRRGREKEEGAIEWRWDRSGNGSERRRLARLGKRGDAGMCGRVSVGDGRNLP